VSSIGASGKIHGAKNLIGVIGCDGCARLLDVTAALGTGSLSGSVLRSRVPRSNASALAAGGVPQTAIHHKEHIHLHHGHQQQPPRGQGVHHTYPPMGAAATSATAGGMGDGVSHRDVHTYPPVTASGAGAAGVATGLLDSSESANHYLTINTTTSNTSLNHSQSQHNSTSNSTSNDASLGYDFVLGDDADCRVMPSPSNSQHSARSLQQDSWNKHRPKADVGSFGSRIRSKSRIALL
jgi:hypothetical protein